MQVPTVGSAFQDEQEPLIVPATHSEDAAMLIPHFVSPIAALLRNTDGTATRLSPTGKCCLLFVPGCSVVQCCSKYLRIQCLDGGACRRAHNFRLSAVPTAPAAVGDRSLRAARTNANMRAASMWPYHTV